MSTLNDIAKVANVSTATVSRALKGDKKIKTETRNKIVEIAKELNYYSNMNNIVFSEVYTKTVGIICPEIISYNYSNLVNSITSNLKKHGFSIILGTTDFELDEERRLLELFAQKNVCGIIIVMFNELEIIEDLKEFKGKHDIPIIQISNYNYADDYDSISICNETAVRKAIQHLVELGHKNIGIIGDRYTNFRNKLMKEAIDDFGLTGNLIISNESRFEVAGYEGVVNMMESVDVMPTAIVTAYDYIALGTIRALRERGLKVPEDVSIIGFDNILTSAYLHKSLTTISIPSKVMGEISSRLMMGKIKDKSQIIQHTLINPELIIRETTIQLIDKNN